MNSIAENLKSLSKTELLYSAEVAVKNERIATMEVLNYFREIERRRLYLEKGFPSLFEMVTKHFGYSSAGAYRRISSMRLIRDVPEAEAKIKSGELTLTAASSVQSFIKVQKGMPISEKRDVLSSCLNKSSRQVEKELASRQPTKAKRENVRYTDANFLRLSLNISEDLYEKLEKLKHVLRLQKVEDVIHYLADRELKIQNQPDPLPAPEVGTRYIPKATKRIVLKKNHEKQCEYKDPVTRQRCEETHKLQFDHIKPFSQGGPNLAENLRLLCGPHNRLAWQTEQRV